VTRLRSALELATTTHPSVHSPPDVVRTGILPCLRVGRHIRFTRAMLEEWVEVR
jgi:hypothetical protein